tara:strand:- start:975 stop:1211 length:237 start_codon:yes stop_codon:yes gene_type:complete
MIKEIKSIIKEILIEKEIDLLQTTKNEIQKLLGQKNLKKHIKKITKIKNRIIIETNSIEAKTELNLLKKKLKTTKQLL